MQKGKWLMGAALAVSLGLAGCGKEKPAAVGSGEPLEAIVAKGFEDKVLMRVNDRPLTQYDFNLWQLSTKQKEATPRMQQELLDRIVEAELMYQRGVELGLDKDPLYARAVTLAAAKNKMLRLQQMEEMVARHETESVKIGDEQAQAYFDANKADIRTSFHFGSLQFATESEARDAYNLIRKSKSFGSVADEVVKKLPGYESGREPKEYWEMKGVTWQMIPPEVMRVVSGMAVDDVSEPIATNGKGYIILKLIGKETLSEADFPSMRAAIISRLRDQAIAGRMDKLRKDMKAKARIEKIVSPAEVNMAPAPSSH